MRRITLFFIVVLASACTRRADVQSAQAADAVTAALRRGDVVQAERIVDDGLSRTNAEPQSESAWRYRLLRGDVLLAKRDLPGATQIAQDALPDAPGFQALRVRQKYLQARLQFAQGRLQPALAIATDALKDAPPGSDLALDIAGFSGQLKLQLGQWSEGESQLESVVAAASAARNHHVEAMAATSLGMGKYLRGRCDEAIAPFEHVIGLTDMAESAVYVRALTNVGMCYSRLGQFDRATAFQLRAVSAAQKRPMSADYEQALGQLGNTYQLQGNTRDGLAYTTRAYQAAVDSKLVNDAVIWAGNLAVAYTNLSQWDEAERFNEEAKRIAAGTRNAQTIYNLENSAAIAAGRGQFDEATRLFNQVLATPGAPPSIVWDAHYGLAGVAIAQKQPQRAAKSFEAALDVIEKTRAGLLKTDYKLSYLTQLIAFYHGYVNLLIAQGEVERAFAVADSSRGRVLAERQGAASPERTTAALMKGLARKTGAVYLSYWLAPGRSYLWVVTGDTIKCLTLPAANEIEALVREHQIAIGNVLVDPLANRESAGDKLYRVLVAPAAPWLTAGAPVVIVPDGALHGINVETLPVDGARRHYWIEDVEIRIAPSLAALTAAAPPSAASGPASTLVVGNAVGRPPEFPELKYAANEMTSIARHFASGRATVIDRDRATPAAYRDARPAEFRYIHFAAHATANVESPLDSAVILSGPDQAFKLYAREVAALPLTADLVTVSACRSAGERAYSGEGLVGFAWAFLRAGAQRVVAGLWDVNDRSTADLMDRMYAGLAAGDPPPRALRNAKLALIRQGGAAASPYAWGAFELFTVAP